MACGNGKFVDLGKSQPKIYTQVFKPSVVVEEWLWKKEDLNCYVNVEGPDAGELLGVVSLSGTEFDHEAIVGRLVKDKFLIQFSDCFGELGHPPAPESRMAPLRLET